MYKTVKYVIHQHDTLKSGAPPHYDFRFEIPNGKMLASFALPKKEIPTHGKKVLAIRTEDHNKKWLTMDKVTIPKTEYGAGKIKIIESGDMDILGYGKTYITFEANNKLLNGKFLLVKFKGKLKTDTRDNNWIFMKLKSKLE